MGPLQYARSRRRRVHRGVFACVLDGDGASRRMNDASGYLLLGVVLFLASMLHSAAGFAIPVLLLGGMEPYEAMAICAVSVVIHTVISVWRTHTKPDWKHLFGMAAIGIVMQPVGVWILGHIVFLGRARVCQIFGCVLV